MIEFKPFYERETDTHNQEYYSVIKSENNHYALWIEIDGLNDGLIIHKFCQCKGFTYKKVECKHLKSLKEELTKWGVEWREPSRVNSIEGDSKVISAMAIHKIEETT